MIHQQEVLEQLQPQLQMRAVLFARQRPRTTVAEALSDANYGALLALQRFDASRGNDWRRWCLLHAGYEMRRGARRRRRWDRERELPEGFEVTATWQLLWSAELSPDGQIVYELARSSDGKLATLRRELRRRGWGLSRIRQALREIRESI